MSMVFFFNSKIFENSVFLIQIFFMVCNANHFTGNLQQANDKQASSSKQKEGRRKISGRDG